MKCVHEYSLEQGLTGWLAGILYVCLVGWYDERRDEEVA